MHRPLATIVMTAALPAFLPSVVLAHPGHMTSLTDVLAHPFFWRDHLLPVVVPGVAAVALAVSLLRRSR